MGIPKRYNNLYFNNKKWIKLTKKSFNTLWAFISHSAKETLSRGTEEKVASEDNIRLEQREEVRRFDLAVQRRVAKLVICPQQSFLRRLIAKVLEEDKRAREKKSVIEAVKRWFGRTGQK